MAINLVQNLESRSINSTVNARIDASSTGATASYYSCYTADEIAINQDGNFFKLVIDLGDSYFQHALLILDDFPDDYPWEFLDSVSKRSYL